MTECRNAPRLARNKIVSDSYVFMGQVDDTDDMPAIDTGFYIIDLRKFHRRDDERHARWEYSGMVIQRQKISRTYA